MLTKGIFDWVGNLILDSVWIKDLPKLDYSLFDDEWI